MATKRALKDVAKDPIAKKAPVVLQDHEGNHGFGHYALTMAIGLIAGVIGGLLSSRIMKII